MCCIKEKFVRRPENRESDRAFSFEKGKREAAASVALPKVSGKSVLFPRNDRPYGLKWEAFQTENVLEKKGRIYEKSAL